MLDSKGFKRPTYNELITDMESEARAKYGADINTSERSFLGIILRLFAWFLSKVWQDTEDTYNSAYVNTADGNQLDRLGPYVGIQRNLSTWATGTIEITGTPGYTVPSGFRLSTIAETFFETLEDITLDAAGNGNGNIQALEPGTIGNVAAGVITIVANPDANVTSVTNPQPTSGGQNKETDPEFRERFAQSTAGGGAATIDSIRSALLRTPGVRAATIIENDKNTPDPDGRPAKSFEAYLLGGDPTDIGQAILANKAAGIESYGNKSITVKDLAGTPHEIKFSYALERGVYIRLTLTKNNQYPADGDKQITSSLIRYVGGEDADGQIYAGLGLGDDVIHSKLIAAAYSVPGIDDMIVETSTDGTTWSDANVTIGANEVAQTTYNLITVVGA